MALQKYYYTKNGEKKLDRRAYQPDTLQKIVSISGRISFILIVCFIILAIKAKPQLETFFDRYFNVDIGNYSWNYKFIIISLYGTILTLIISIIGLFINKKRKRRKADSYNSALVLCSVISIILILIFSYILY